METDKRQFYLESLRHQILFKLKGDPGLRMDFDGLLELYASADVALSTLKRIFGIDRSNPDYFPSTATLHKLARFTGRANWNEFVREVYNGQQRPESGAA